MKNICRFLILLNCLALSYSHASEPAAVAKVTLPGQRADGSTLLPNQWSLRPVGKQIPLGDFPVNIAVHPDGHFAAVLHSGYGQHEIITVDIDHGTVVDKTPVKEAFYGLEFAKSGARLYCSGSAEEVIHVFDFKDGHLTTNQDIRISPESERGIPSGLAVSGNPRELYVANVFGQFVSKVDPMSRQKVKDYSVIQGVPEIVRQKNFQKEGDDDEDQAAITKRMKAALDPVSADAPFPYACRLDDRKHLLYVSLWAKSAVSVIDLNSGLVVTNWPTQEQSQRNDPVAFRQPSVRGEREPQHRHHHRHRARRDHRDALRIFHSQSTAGVHADQPRVVAGREHAVRRQFMQQQYRRVRCLRHRQEPFARVHPGGLVSYVGSRDAEWKTSARRQWKRHHLFRQSNGPTPGKKEERQHPIHRLIDARHPERH